MSHSIEKHKKAYEDISSTSHAALAHNIVQWLSSKGSAKAHQQLDEKEQTTRPKKKFWTLAQVALIEDFFKNELRQLTHAKSEKCKSFMRMYPIPGRMPKHVQDKVKGLIDKKKTTILI